MTEPTEPRTAQEWHLSGARVDVQGIYRAFKVEQIQEIITASKKWGMERAAEIVMNHWNSSSQSTHKAIITASEKRGMEKGLQSHAGDCSYYSSTINNNHDDGICTCGYAFQFKATNHGKYYDELYSSERAKMIPQRTAITRLPCSNPLKAR